MYLEHFNLKTSPFLEEPDAEIFFPEAGREDICESLLQDLESGKPLVKVIGEEGIGKTLLCRVLQERIPANYEVVYLDNPVGSFENLLRIVCLDLGMEPTSDAAEASCREVLADLLQKRAEGNDTGKVILLIDEAEKVFLATLERLVRLVCDSESAGILHVILVGRAGLDANLEQLAFYCSNVDIQSGYTLEPLGKKETAAYLDFRLKAAGLDPEKSKEVFTLGAVEKIYNKAKGNPRLTNILAEESLQTSCSEKSFLVLLDHVNPESEEPVRKSNGVNAVAAFIDPFLSDKKRLAVAGGVLFFLLITLLFSRGDDETEIAEYPENKVEENVDQVVQLESNSNDKDEEPVVPDVRDSEPEPMDQAEKSATVKVQPPEFIEAPAQAVKEEERDGQALYEKRLRASSKWIAGVYRNEYTIQLMMLASDQALRNLQRDLAKDSYYGVRDKIYILRKMTSPPTLFVFYGTYKTLAEARQARNNMPVFLRKHHPYPLSIRDALKKTED